MTWILDVLKPSSQDRRNWVNWTGLPALIFPLIWLPEEGKEKQFLIFTIISHWLGDVNLFFIWKYMLCFLSSCDTGEKSNEDAFFFLSVLDPYFSQVCVSHQFPQMKPNQPTWNLTRANARFFTWDRYNSRHKNKLGEECLENSRAEKILGMLVDGKFNLS